MSWTRTFMDTIFLRPPGPSTIRFEPPPPKSWSLPPPKLTLNLFIFFLLLFFFFFIFCLFFLFLFCFVFLCFFPSFLVVCFSFYLCFVFFFFFFVFFLFRPSAGPPNNFALFSLFHRNFRSFLSLWVFSWNCGQGSPWSTQSARLGWCHFLKPMRPVGRQGSHIMTPEKGTGWRGG